MSEQHPQAAISRNPDKRGRSLLARIRNTYSSKGFAGTVLHLINAPIWRIRHYIDYSYFDRKYGVETLRIEKDYLKDIHAPDISMYSFYEAAVWRKYSKGIRSLGIRNSQYVFIDLGSGKGRAVMFAALMNFKKAIGVEISEHLHRIAESNLEIFRRRKATSCGFDLVCADVTQYRFPNDDLVVFMNNPFYDEIMQKVVDNLHTWLKNCGRELYILYMNPDDAVFLDTSNQIIRLSHTASFKTYKKGVRDAPLNDEPRAISSPQRFRRREES